MRSQVMQYVTVGGLLLVGLVFGFQMGKERIADQPAVSLAQESHSPASMTSADYFPAGYVNTAKVIEPLPAQF